MLTKINKSRRQAGDTIVEVLISIAVVSLVLAGAYASSNHSTLVSQDTQEHSQAMQLVQSEIEMLKQAGSVMNGDCFALTSSSGTVATDVSGANCIVDQTSQKATGPTDLPQYTLSISNADPQCANAYTVKAQWESLISSNQANVEMCYGL